MSATDSSIVPSPTPTNTTDTRIQELCNATGKPRDAIVDDAICRLYETVFGYPSEQDPTNDEQLADVHFRKFGNNRPASVLLRQGPDMEFVLEEPFRYVGSDHERSGTTDVEWIVPRSEITDLASVPDQLTWLVPRYGRHTLPALLHDHLQKKSTSNPPSTQPNCSDVTKTAAPKPDVSSETADTIFREGMRSTGVPFVRFWLMWAAVSVRTILQVSGDTTAKKIVLVLWKAAVVLCIADFALAGLVGLPWLAFQLRLLFAWGADIQLLGDVMRWLQNIGSGALSIVTGPPRKAVVLGVLLGPLVLSGVFLRRWRVGVLCAYALLFVAFPLFFVGLAGVVYRAAEALMKVLVDAPNPVRTEDFRAQSADGGE